MDVWVIWLIAACVLGVGEMHQGGFYLAPFAAGAALAAVLALLGVGVALSAVVFIVGVGDRVRHAAPGWRSATVGCRPSIRTGAAALVGRPGDRRSSGSPTRRASVA